MALNAQERETIINFNEGEDMAYIFTYNKRWQTHIEEKLGVKPTNTNGFGGKDYEIPKKWVKLPRTPKKLTDEARSKLVAQGKASQSNLRSGNRVLQPKSEVMASK